MDINDNIILNDRHYKYLTEDDILNLKNKALEEATLLVDKYSMDKIQEFLKQRNFKIVSTKNNTEAMIKYRARILIGKENVIHIYDDSVDEFIMKYPELSRDKVINMFLAHEFLHLLEYDNVIESEFKVRKKILGFSKLVRVEAYSEIIANEFARVVSNSDINPMEIDRERYEI